VVSVYTVVSGVASVFMVRGMASVLIVSESGYRQCVGRGVATVYGRESGVATASVWGGEWLLCMEGRVGWLEPV
jgi:hypothetical protein